MQKQVTGVIPAQERKQPTLLGRNDLLKVRLRALAQLLPQRTMEVVGTVDTSIGIWAVAMGH